MGLALRCVAAVCLWLQFGLAAAAPPDDWPAQVRAAVALRAQGELRQAIELLGAASRQATPQALRHEAAGELGIALLQAHQADQAEVPLRQAHAYFADARRGRYAFYLGNLALLRKDLPAASRFYAEAAELADDRDAVRLLARLNQLRFLPGSARPAELRALAAALDGLGAEAPARLHLNLGHSARLARETALAYRHLEAARRGAARTQDPRLQVEALDALAQLYEDAGRGAEALNLSEQGLAAARPLERSAAADLLIELEWRRGRLFKAAAREADALAAYLRAVELIELVRQDIPIEYEDGRSSFRATLEPIYLGYADLLLRQADPRQGQLRSIIDTIELIRQTELQDFLGDRCAVEAVQGGSAGKLAPGMAVLYPLLLPDRLELLLETPAAIQRRVVPVTPDRLRSTATLFAAALRNGSEGYLGDARQLYQWLLAPFEKILADNATRTLVVVPDGVLRLVPVGALHDGERYAIEKFAVSMATGLSMTNSAPPAGRSHALIAGVSEPGAVVEKLSRAMAAQILEPGAAGGEAAARGLARRSELRALRPQASRSAAPDETRRELREVEELKQRLALPGVKDEIEALAGILRGPRLLDADFSLDRFRRETESGGYQVLHIASHGVFGGSAETSFIMTHDDILTMNGLQSLLRSEVFQKQPIELLSLSACQTAEGNDRSPLGLSGAAIKARAKSVLGTLWPVEDNAARMIMERLYAGLHDAHLSKAEALRQAQLQLVAVPETAHPFFWAPFVLIGNWQ